MKPIALTFQPVDASGQRRPAVFLDRDGVLNQNRADYVRTWQQVEFPPGVFQAMQRLAASPFVIVVVTNQSAVGRGLMTAEGLAVINGGIVQQVQQAGGRIDAVYACPHRPDEGCPCRKPRPGMLWCSPGVGESRQRGWPPVDWAMRRCWLIWVRPWIGCSSNCDRVGDAAFRVKELISAMTTPEQESSGVVVGSMVNGEWLTGNG